MFIFYEVISLLYYSQIKFHLNLLNSVIYTSVWEHNEVPLNIYIIYIWKTIFIRAIPGMKNYLI